MSSHPPTDVTRQAAHWVVQLRCADRSANAERDFADWLRASPLHVAEYLRAVEVWEGLCDPALDGLRTRAELISEAQRSTALPLPLPLMLSRRASPSAAAHRWRRHLPRAVAALCAAVLLAGWFGWQRFAALDLATGRGELRSAVLADGSILELNTQSEVRVIFTARQRRIDLVRGEAFFQVAKNPARPFVVFTDLATATAVGTRFSVYRAANGTIVTVEEGRVVVRDIAHSGRPGELSQQTAGIEVEPGTQAEARPRGAVLTHHTDLARSLAWRQRRLVFDGAPLREVIEEFNRYNAVPLVLVDPQLGDRRISGVFGANDPESLIDFLAQVDHIRVNRPDPRSIRIGGDAP